MFHSFLRHCFRHYSHTVQHEFHCKLWALRLVSQPAFFPFQCHDKSLSFSRAKMICRCTFTFPAEERFVMNHKKDRRGLFTVLLLWIEFIVNFIGVVWENKMGSLPSALNWRVWVSLASSSFPSHSFSLLLRPQVNSSLFFFCQNLFIQFFKYPKHKGQHRKYKK